MVSQIKCQFHKKIYLKCILDFQSDNIYIHTHKHKNKVVTNQFMRFFPNLLLEKFASSCEPFY